MSDMSKETALLELISDVSLLMENFFQSGFDTVHDSSIAELEKAVKTTAQYGMEFLSGLLEKLLELVCARRHKTRSEPDKMAEIYVQIVEYLYVAKSRISYDAGKVYYEQEYQRKEGEEIC